MLCLENIETVAENSVGPKGKKERAKCPHCKKVLKYEQNYIENKYVKPLEQTHTIIMSHNLNILHYIYKKLVCKNLASVGYYVGGMKEIELKRTEKQQVILASFSMAQEGLDVPTLNAEFLITPKTDIIQIVGRILRAKHKFSHPIIYDFVDSHEVFQRQWLKRKSYYKKQNYKIIGTNNTNYNKDFSKWKSIYEPKISLDNKVCLANTKKSSLTKKSSIKSNSSSDKSITSDTDTDSDVSNDSDNESKDKLLTGKCLLQLKK
jgi:superfamily II DNA or RNA helicase